MMEVMKLLVLSLNEHRILNLEIKKYQNRVKNQEKKLRQARGLRNHPPRLKKNVEKAWNVGGASNVGEVCKKIFREKAFMVSSRKHMLLVVR